MRELSPVKIHRMKEEQRDEVMEMLLSTYAPKKGSHLFFHDNQMNNPMKIMYDLAMAERTVAERYRAQLVEAKQVISALKRKTKNGE